MLVNQLLLCYDILKNKEIKKGVTSMSIVQEQAVEMIGLLPDDRVEIIIEVMKGFMKPLETKKNQSKSSRIGVARGKFTVPDDIDDCNEEIAEMFGVNE